MSARIPPGHAELWMQFNLSSDPEPMYSAVGLDLATGVSADQPTTDSILTTAYAAIDNAVSSDYSLGPGHVIWGQDGGDLRIDGSMATVVGGAISNSLPNNTAYLVRKITGSGGRRGRGRMYIPGVPEANVVPNGEITTAWRGTVQAAVDNLEFTLEALASVETLALLHDTAPFAPTTITGLVLQTKVATQRRRMRR